MSEEGAEESAMNLSMKNDDTNEMTDTEDRVRKRNPTEKGISHVPPVSSSDDAIAAVVQHLKRPPSEIKRFDGDPFEYCRFLRQFNTKVVMNTDTDDERLNFLEQFTTGEPNKIVKAFSYLPAQQGYAAALKELNERYGDDEVIANAFVKRALSWPAIKGDNPKGLNDFALFLSECESAVNSIPAVQVLEYVDNMKKIVSKLPFFCHDKWRSVVHAKKRTGEQVSFRDLVTLVKTEARKLNDPIYGRDAINADQQGQSKAVPKRSNVKISKGTFATSLTEERSVKQPCSQASSANNQAPKTQRPPSHPAFNAPCMFCSGCSHCLAECAKLGNQPYRDRIAFLKTKALCYSCLKGGHMARFCKNRASCERCSGHHPSVLHTEERFSTDNNSSVEKQTQKEAVSACADFSQVSDGTIEMGAGEGYCTMAIIPVKVRLKNGLKVVDTYAFLDPGSSVSFCSDNLMRQLGGQGKRLKITLDTMGSRHTMDTQSLDGLEVCSLDLQNVVPLPRVYTKDQMPVSSSHIPSQKDIAEWQHLHDVTLPQIDAKVELLIGNNVPDAYSPLQIRTGERGSPHATETLLGWVVWNVIRPAENMQGISKDIFPVNRIEVRAIEEIEEITRLEKQLRNYINMDFPERYTFDATKQHSHEDKLFLRKVSESIKLVDGHFQINLPFRQDNVILPDNEPQARDRLKSLKKRLQRDPKLHDDYRGFMEKIVKDGYAEVVPGNDLARNDGKVWFIPHHGVYHPQKPTKIRVVFDCSAKFHGVSLNSLLIPGPNLTNSLVGVLLRFRQEPVAIMGDVEAMFHQVRVPKQDADCLRFLWWPGGNLETEPAIHRMVVHLFGAVSSPSCANSALRATATECKPANQTTEASKSILNNFYVDDCLASCETEEKAISLIKGVSEVCARGGFRVTKWVSSSPAVIESVPVEERAKQVKDLDFEKDALPTERALGIKWNVERDSFEFSVTIKPQVPTRRSILSTVSSVFDPLGFLAPYILTAKILLQDLCMESVGWDVQITGKDLQRWQKWLEELPELERFEHSRCYKPENFGKVKTCDIHIFSDASNSGYGMVSYLRLTNEEKQVHCCFLMSKARVAPLKRMTIPRMELTAAVIAVRISRILLRELEYSVDNIRFWTDSTSVLKYITNETARFQTFVANRVSEIRELTNPDQWNFVDGNINPADAASRGLSMEKFLREDTWLEGPKFLWLPESEWIKQTVPTNLPDGDPEVRCVSSAVTSTPAPSCLHRLFSHYSNWTKLKRAVAWLLKGLQNLKKWCKLRMEVETDLAKTACDTSAVVKMESLHLQHFKASKQKVKSEKLTVELIEQAEVVLVKHTQHQYFGEDISTLKQAQFSGIRKSGLPKSLLKLDPFVEDGLLRVGGRLRRADIPIHAKFPILLPKKATITKLILEDCHRQVGHQGKGQMLSTLRQKYWILGATQAIKTLLSKCVLCRKYRAKGEQQKMSDLPTERLQVDDPPFTHTGMDYFGPLQIRRSRSIVKRYGVLFTCLSTRAVHLEIAHSLDTDSCVDAIRRFISRRGPVKFIRSDNGTNLVGAQREMKEEIERWNTSKIETYLQQTGISWKFNPPTGSHFGGIWERLIRSTRKILNALLKEQGHRLDDEALQTLMCEVEAILNNRPLTELSDDPNDLQALTPNHLLYQRAGENLPPGLFKPSDNFVRRRWRQVQYLADVFWTRWTREYLPLLQSRQKWNDPKRNVEVNDIVLLVDSSPRNSWTLGRVVETYKDTKGFVRSVRVRTQTNILVRPISKLCVILEGNSE